MKTEITTKKKTTVKKAAKAKKEQPKPGTLAAIQKAMVYAKKHPIKFIWE